MNYTTLSLKEFIGQTIQLGFIGHIKTHITVMIDNVMVKESENSAIDVINGKDPTL